MPTHKDVPPDTQELDEDGGGNAALYTIGSVARLAGVPAATLRNWEARYGIPRAARTTPGRQRLYTAAEAALAQVLARRVVEGLPIRKAVATVVAERLTPARLARAVEEAARQLDAVAVQSAFAEAAAVLPADAVWATVACPTLRALGAQCATGADISAVALVTEVVLTWLRGLLVGAAGEAGEPTIVVTGGPGERHELGSLMLLWRLRSQGWRTVYLGPDAPLVALEAAWAGLRADIFCVTATTRASAAAGAEALEALARQAPASPGGRLSYAGPGFAGMDALHRRLGVHALFLGSDLDHAARTALSLYTSLAIPLFHQPSEDT